MLKLNEHHWKGSSTQRNEKKGIDSILTTLPLVIEVATKATEVKSFTLEIEVQETCDVES